MVYLRDEGSTFDAPLDVVWKYIFDEKAHGAAHTSSRKPKFEEVSAITFLFGSERLLGGTWDPDQMRITMVPPVAVVTEWTEGKLAGSKLIYLYSPKGEKTQVDAYGEFSSKTLDTGAVETMAREFLDGEFRDDAPAVRAYAAKLRHGAKPA